MPYVYLALAGTISAHFYFRLTWSVCRMNSTSSIINIASKERRSSDIQTVAVLWVEYKFERAMHHKKNE